MNHPCTLGSDCIAIVMASYNGERYIKEQLDSIRDQTYQNWHLYVRDDGSKDKTREIVEAFARQDPRVTIVSDDEGNLGYNRNFYKLMGVVSEPYIAFCDQDDVWMPSKLETILSAMKSLEGQSMRPCLVHSDVQVTNNNLEVVQAHFIGRRGNRKGWSGIIFANAVQGAAMMINRSLASVALPIPPSLPFDFHIALICEFTGERKFIEKPLSLYRQHANNVIGANISAKPQALKSSGAAFYTESLLAGFEVYRHIFGELAVFSSRRDDLIGYRAIFESRNPIVRLWYFCRGGYQFSRRKDWLLMIIALLFNKDLKIAHKDYVDHHRVDR